MSPEEKCRAGGRLLVVGRSLQPGWLATGVWQLNKSANKSEDKTLSTNQSTTWIPQQFLNFVNSLPLHSFVQLAEESAAQLSFACLPLLLPTNSLSTLLYHSFQISIMCKCNN